VSPPSVLTMIGVVTEQDSSKAPCPIVLTDGGIESFGNELHPLKADLPTLLGGEFWESKLSLEELFGLLSQD